MAGGNPESANGYPPPAFRPDIQVLRAFAVVAVMLYHVDLAVFQGGFLGVDVFFVVSGYVIANKILHELRAGTFSFAGFYVSRLRRILPAAAVTVILVLIAGAILLPVSDFRALGRSALLAQLWVANIGFWLESGYFDQDSYLKPLLHLWSLSVEEQFYLFWPMILVVAFRFARRLVLPIVITVGLASIVACELVRPQDAAQTFFLTPYRAFQFAAGAALCFFRPHTGKYSSVGYAAGLFLAVLSILMLSESDPMPGLLSLPPVVGAMMCIHFGRSKLAGMLAVRPIVSIGNASYSLYLAHWPPIVFYRVWSNHVDALSTIWQHIGLLAAGFALGYALHLAVEKPLRRPGIWSGTRQWRIGGAVAVYVTSITVAASAWATHGWDWRVPEAVRKIATSAADLKKERDQVVRPFNRADFPVEGANNVVVLGDSHGLDTVGALGQNGAVNIRRLTLQYRCQPTLGPWPIEEGRETHFVTSESAAKECENRVRSILSNPVLDEVAVIVIAARWKSWAVENLPEFIAALRQATDTPVVIFGPTVEFKLDVPKIVERFAAIEGADGFATRYENLERRELNERLKTIAGELGLPYVDKFAVLCGDDACPIFIPKTDTLTIWDYGHWTAKGAAYFGSLYKTKLPDIAPLLFGPDAQDVSSGAYRNGG